MFNFDHIARVTVAAVGALILSTLSVAAAVGPGHSVDAGRTSFASIQLGTQADG